jgi:hypothetical protein
MSGLFVTPTADIYNVIRIPKFALVDDVWLEVTTACTAGASITVGFGAYGSVSAVTSGFMSDDIAKPGEVGMKRAQRDNLLSFPGRYFSGGNSILTVTLAGTFTAGVFRFFMGYSVIR